MSDPLIKAIFEDRDNWGDRIQGLEQQLFVSPCREGLCQTCGVAHDETAPHDATSFRYRYLFAASHPQGHAPTWEDAMSHCEEATKIKWRSHLARIGVKPSSPDVFGGIKSNDELQGRLKKNPNPNASAT